MHRHGTNEGSQSRNNENQRQDSYRMLSCNDVPPEMRHPAIHHGYRLTNQNWTYYTKSLFRWHNETLNVWTQLGGLGLMLYQTIYYFNFYKSRDSALQWTVLSFGICSCLALFNSALTHLYHSKSAPTHYRMFLFDYIGAVLWTFGTAYVTHYGITSKDAYDYLGPNYIKVLLVLTFINFLNHCYAKLWNSKEAESVNNLLQPVIVTGNFVVNFLPMLTLLPRYIDCINTPDCSVASLNHVSFIVIFAILATLAFLLHQPEVTYPGRFDVIGHSHQIFHVLVILTMYLQMKALHVDFVSGVNSHCEPDLFTALIYIALLYVVCLVTIIVVDPIIIKRCQQTNTHDSKKRS